MFYLLIGLELEIVNNELLRLYFTSKYIQISVFANIVK